MKPAAALLSLSVLVFTSLSAKAAAPEPDPVVWGIITHNSGCIVFAEGHKTSGRFYGVAVTTKTMGKLTVLETHDYTYDQKEVIETQENMDNLTRLSQRDHIKFVKIPEKHSPELLEKARALCKQDAE